MGSEAVCDGQNERQLPLQRVVFIVALANLFYFAIEFVMARRIGSVSLFADSIDFLEDTSLNLLILLSLSWSARNRARIGMFLALLLLVPTVEFLVTAWQKLHSMSAPPPLQLSLTGIGALCVNFGCALLLTRHRHRGGSRTHAAFLSSRNDVAANVGILVASGLTVLWPSAWPDLAVGILIAAMNADAARKVWSSAHRERAIAAG